MQNDADVLSDGPKGDWNSDQAAIRLAEVEIWALTGDAAVFATGEANGVVSGEVGSAGLDITHDLAGGLADSSKAIEAAQKEYSDAVRSWAATEAQSSTTIPVTVNPQ